MRYFCALIIFALATLPGLPAFAGSDEKIAGYKRSGWAETDFSKRSIKLSEIFSGGPPKDGIPSIDKPIFKPISEITNIAGNEPVIGLQINGDARAYPLRILMWHEIVNDTVGGKPITVTFCPLCNAAIVFDRTVNGKVLDFGTTGLLRNSDLVMYDRQSQSWWQQFTGTAIVGSMLGTELTVLPVRLESYDNYKKRLPKGKVQVPNNPGLRQYGQNPYTNYDKMAFPFLYTGSTPKDIKPMERVIAFEQDGKTIVYAMTLLAAKKKLITGKVTINWTAGQSSALSTSTIAKGRDVGNITVQENRVGKMVDIPYDVTFAFVIHAFKPEAKINK